MKASERGSAAHAEVGCRQDLAAKETRAREELWTLLGSHMSGENVLGQGCFIRIKQNTEDVKERKIQ